MFSFPKDAKSFSTWHRDAVVLHCCTHPHVLSSEFVMCVDSDDEDFLSLFLTSTCIEPLLSEQGYTMTKNGLHIIISVLLAVNQVYASVMLQAGGRTTGCFFYLALLA